MARTGRPNFKPTPTQRERVKLLKADGWSNERIARRLGIARNTLEKVFAWELEDGADEKRAELLDYALKGAKKGNASLIKWLIDRNDRARAHSEIERRAQGPRETPEETPEKLGKKAERQKAAEEVTGKFAPPAPPPKLH